MAKKQRTQPVTAPIAQQQQAQQQAPPPPREPKEPFNYRSLKDWFFDFRGQAIILALLAFILYCNTFTHEFAHDDGIVIVKNEYVLEGFGGIHGILTKDAYDSYYRQLNTTNQLKGGRYRPLSIVTFAIEQQFLGAVKEADVDSVLHQAISYGVSGPSQQQLVFNMHVRHVFSTLWYMLGVVVLLWFFRYVTFPKYPLVAFIAALLFTVHPVHTEVVANVKSRDEIMSLLFMCLTFIYAVKYEEDRRNIKSYVLGVLSLFLAFMSKEYAITMMVFIPMVFYIFRGYSFYRSISIVLPYSIMVTWYLAARLNAVAPPTEAGGWQSQIEGVGPMLGIALAAYALWTYTRPRKEDENSLAGFRGRLMPFIPYFIVAALYLKVRLDALPKVIESAAKEVLNNPYLYVRDNTQKIATEIASSLYYVKFLLFPHPLSADYSYAQIPYKDFDHPMVWLSIVVHLAIIGVMVAFFPRRNPTVSLRSSSFEVTGKGMIFFAIAFYMVHLLLVNNLVFDIGATLGERLIYHSSVGFAMVAAWVIYKGFMRMRDEQTAYKGMAALMAVVVGLMGFKTIDRNRAWKNDSTLFGTDIKTVPNSVLVNANVAASYITMADFAKDSTEREQYLRDAVKILDHTLSIHTRFVAAYLNRGIAWYKLGNIEKTQENIEHVRALYPTYPTLPGMYKLICDYYLKEGWEKYGKVGRYAEAVEVYKKGLQVDSTNVDLWYNMGGAYYTNKQPLEAIAVWQKALKLQPNNQQVQAGLQAAMQMLNGGQQQQQAQPGKK